MSDRNSPTPAEPTFRPVSLGMEKHLHVERKVLDHGFIRVVDYMGDDSAVVQAARVSYGRGTKKVNEDRGLINYLMRHAHTTPFEMAEIKLHVKLPIFVARQWIRHRTASVNEYSARYSMLDREFYVPERQHLAAQSTANRQGRDEILDEEEADFALRILKADAERSYSNYVALLNLDESGEVLDSARSGLARELARMNLNLSFYTQWYWKTNLHNLMNFLRLRADSHAQYEIRAYANILLDIMADWVPHTFEAFKEYRLNAVTLSATAASNLQRALKGEKITFESSGLSKREWTDLIHAFNLE
ncbi:FAD-dependent thymidylate synthase (plasmid) [Rhizobium leguminosarum]|uniref:Flavin-dependent thymidylate synthase n=2 Tax=Rhizobium leguminosarum TaxID=384 RepID=A0A1L3ZKF5_RHILE|nr:FAD-dependent thymidylate synthase [Rhizobium leguminosarum]